MSFAPAGRPRFLFGFERLESRFTPDVTPTPVPPMLFVPDWSGGYQSYTPTLIPAFENAVDTFPGGVLDFSTVSVVTSPVRGQVSVDPTTGVIQYVPNYLLPNGLPPGQPPGQVLPESFQYTVRDNLGNVSNIATATFTGGIAPVKAGPLVARDGGLVTTTLRSGSINLYDYLDTDPGVVADLNSVSFTKPPSHGTVEVNPATGVLTYTPEFGYTGFDEFRYFIQDTTGQWRSESDNFVMVNTAAPRLQADPLGGQMLVVDGTSGDDTVVVSPGRRGEVSVTLNGVTSGPFRPTGRVVVLGYGGADRVQVAGTVAVPTWLAGGNGHDTLIAGGGPAVLLGGPGNDLLAAGRARDVVIGGTGTDTLTGTGNDVLIPGTTAFDLNQQALNAIRREWDSNHAHGQRVLNLTGQFTRRFADRLNGDTFLTGGTVANDGQADTVSPGGFESLMFPAAPDVVIEPTPPARRSFPRLPAWFRLPGFSLPAFGHHGGLLFAGVRQALDGYADRISTGRG